MPDRPDVPPEHLERLRPLLDFPECVEESAWTGTRWRVRHATVAHAFGGEDQLIRILFRAEPDEVGAFSHLGAPYFKASWGEDVVGLLLDDDTERSELAELLTDSYCIQAPLQLAARIDRPA